MREILFKAKRLDNGEWVEGYYQKRKNAFENDEHLIFRCESYHTWEYVEVDPETLCQYTGLTDKNGNKIWENDICDRYETFPEIVKQRNGDWTLDYSYAYKEEYGYNYCNLGFYVCDRSCVKVIGNIFDNPELLETDKILERMG